MNENTILFSEVKDSISSLARSLMDFSKKSFNHDLKYMPTLNIPSALHGFNGYDHMMTACKNADESITRENFLSGRNYDQAMYQIRKNSPELTIAQQDALLNKLVELDDLILSKDKVELKESGTEKVAVILNNASETNSMYVPDSTLSVEEQFIQLIEHLKKNKVIGGKNITIKRKLSNSWRFIYAYIPLNNKLAFNVFSDIRDPEKQLTVSIELSYIGNKSELSYFDDFLDKANSHANSSNIELLVANLAASYKQPTNKNYAKQASFDKVLFQSPAGSVCGVNTVLDGIECIQLANYKGKLNPDVIECAVEKGIKLVEHLMKL